MAVMKTSRLEKYYRLCVDKTLELSCVDFIVKGGLICETLIETFDVDGNLQFRFIPPTVRVATEHWEFAGELHLFEKSLGAARGALVWLEEVSDYLCLATAGAPVKMEPFCELLTEAHALPPSHLREILYNEIKVGRVITRGMLSRVSTFMHLAPGTVGLERMKSFRRSLWWFRHGANIEVESPLLAYMSFFNSLEILLRYNRSNRNNGKPTRNNKTKDQFISIFDKDIGSELYQLCYGTKGSSLYDLRNDIDHGLIVELGSGMLRVAEGLIPLKALVVDLALCWLKQIQSFGGSLTKKVIELGSEGLVILSPEEASDLGCQKPGSIIV